MQLPVGDVFLVGQKPDEQGEFGYIVYETGEESHVFETPVRKEEKFATIEISYDN